MPNESEVHGLVALMELHASRQNSRITADGQPILLLNQDRGRWDLLLIGRGLQALHRAAELARQNTQHLGQYALQAAISACHARARTAAETDWPQIVALYDGLVELTQSPIVALNQAVAVSMADGPAAALVLVQELAQDKALENYRFLHAVLGDLLQRLQRLPQAKAAFEKAATLADNRQERALMLARAEQCQRQETMGNSQTN